VDIDIYCLPADAPASCPSAGVLTGSLPALFSLERLAVSVSTDNYVCMTWVTQRGSECGKESGKWQRISQCLDSDILPVQIIQL